MMKQYSKKNIDKVIFEEIMKDHQITSIGSFKNYLAQLWQSLSSHSLKKNKGINKMTFGKYFQISGLINERLFCMFNESHNNYINPTEFINGMTKIYCQPFEQLVKFIFDFYDFDHDKKIRRDDVRVVLVYVPLKQIWNPKEKKKSYDCSDFISKIAPQREVDDIIMTAFGNKMSLHENEFMQVIHEVSSDLFVSSLMYFLNKKPFTNETLKFFDQYNINKSCKTPVLFQKNRIVSPSTMTVKFFSPLSTKLANGFNSFNKGQPILNILSGVIPVNLINEIRKDSESTLSLHQTSDMEDDSLDYELNETEYHINESYFTNEENNALNSNLFHEGFVCKYTKNHILKQRWYKLVNKDLFEFKAQTYQVHKKFHHIINCFVEKNKSVEYNQKTYFSFSLIFPNKRKTFYIENQEEYNQWIEKLQRITNYKDIHKYYKLEEILGTGTNGIVKRGINKITQQLVAIKIIAKYNKSMKEKELIQMEIDTMKLCHHPYIIKVYEIIEDSDYIYIIMEYCQGGDLNTFLKQRSDKLSESRAAVIIHKLGFAIEYLHSYGIIHRNIKPKNILLIDSSVDNIDIRLTDFSMSIILGPEEKSKEPVETLHYAAPEIIMGRLYDKSVDLWNIGMIAYYLIYGEEPFYHKDLTDKQIIQRIINTQLYFNEIKWKYISKEGKEFINRLLQKSPEKRMSIQSLLMHEWLNIFGEGDPHRLKNQRSLTTYSISALNIDY